VVDEALDEFMAELAELLTTLERDLVSVDAGRNPAEVVAQTFRIFHTVKGTAGFLGFAHLREVSHAAEDLLDEIRDGNVPWNRIVTDVLLEVLDALRLMMDEAIRTGKDGDEAYAPLVERLRAAAAPTCQACEAGTCAVHATASDEATTSAAPIPAAAPQGPPPAPAFAPKKAAPKLVRKPGAAAAPLTLTPAAAAATPVAVPPAPPPASAPAPAPATAAPAPGPELTEATSTLRVPVAVLDRLMNLVGELVLARNQLICHEATREDPRLTETSQRIDSLTAGLQESVMKARMQPIDHVFSRLPRVVRDTANAVGKQARLVTVGQDTELDKTLLEAIKDPLVHAVRNSVDHGIEKPELRLAAGKVLEGTVTVRAFQDGGQVIVEIEDDGGGVALDRVRQKAVALGLITAEEAERFTERETVDLVFRPGFSTAASVTQISGRGVGMDVVRTNVERIGGSVEMVSRTGQGSTCRIRVPLTLVIVPALVVESSGQMFAIPQASLAELVRITPEREARMIADLGGTPVLRLRGEVLPLVDLAALMQTGEARRAVDGGRSVVVLRSQGRTFGLLVDDVADTEEIVVKPLARQLQQLGVYSGATVRGDGRVALVLDVNGLARRASVLEDGDRGVQAAAAVETSAAARRTYLVLRGADDGRLAIPLGEVRRLEEIDPSHIEPLGAGEAVQYRGAILPLVRLSDALPERRQRPRVAPPQAAGEKVPIVVQCLEGRDVGLVVDTVLDVVDEAVTLDVSRARAGVAGCAVIQGRITEVLDTSALLAAHLARPEAAHG